MSNKLYLKGFSNFGYHKIKDDDAEKYSGAGERVKVPSARTCSPTDNRTDFSINADDGVWDSGSDWESTTLEIAVAQMELPTLAELTGATVNEDNSIDEGPLDNAPSIAPAFAALGADGGYRLYRYYSAKATNIAISHTTKGESTDAQVYTITFKATPRKCDGKIRSTTDVAKGAALTWLDTVTPVGA